MARKITRLENLLLENHLRQYEVGGSCGIHHNVMSEYVRGIKAFSAKHLISLSKYFNVSPDEIIGWIEIDSDEVEEN